MVGVFLCYSISNHILILLQRISQLECLMQILDTHVHVWTHSSEFPWAADAIGLPVSDAHPEALLELMDQNGVAWAVLVHYIGYRWDNRYAAHARKRFSSRFTAVCRVNPTDVRAPDQLSYWTEVHGFRGVRFSPDPQDRNDWFSTSLMLPLFKRANELNVPVLILTQPSRLTDLAAILDRAPETTIVLDHMADCINGTDADREQLVSLARFPHVYLKMGHLPSKSSHELRKRETRGFLKSIHQIYGASRIMWGSDWPFCLSEKTYSEAVAQARDAMDFLTGEDLEWIYLKTALQIWPFSDGKNFGSQDAGPVPNLNG